MYFRKGKSSNKKDKLKIKLDTSETVQPNRIVENY